MEKDKRKNRFHIWGNDFYKGILEIKDLKIFALKPVPRDDELPIPPQSLFCKQRENT